MRLKIETTGVKFLCTWPAQARTERDAGAPRVDNAGGQGDRPGPVAVPARCTLEETGDEVLNVTVARALELAPRP